MRFNEWRELELKDVCSYSKEKIAIEQVDLDNYISTENMLVEKGGKTQSSGLPSAKTVSKYMPGNVLVSNIRPYFKKIWYGDKVGGASNDVLIFQNSPLIESKFLYYFLSQDKFFEFMTGTSKGTKMPRGDKDAIMKYSIFLPPILEQKSIANILSSLDGKIELNNQMNKTLEEMAQALFKRWFVDFEFPSEDGEPYKLSGGEMVDSELGMIPKGYLIGTLDEMCKLSAGGDKPKNFSKFRTEEYNIPIYSNGIENEGLYGFTNEAKIFGKSVTVSARGTIGFICLRQVPYVPIVRLISLNPKKSNLSSEYLYHWLKGMNIQATGTTQQQLTVPQFKKSKILIPNANIINSTFPPVKIF